MAQMSNHYKYQHYFIMVYIFVYILSRFFCPNFSPSCCLGSNLVTKLREYTTTGFVHPYVQTVSSTGNHMVVQFVTNSDGNFHGFSAKINYISINTICKDWLNITSGFLTSPNYPTMNCNWVITAPIGSTISLQFHLFQVK